jgi:translation initiation factor 2 beta subunit (eIF-2beta)/eIF-5
MTLNINKSTDISYRYKMDKIIISMTGRGGNCHTILDNIDKISSQINTSSELLLNYIGNVLGCNTPNHCLKGHYNIDKIQEIIFNFISFATLCSKCSIPELSPSIIKEGKNCSLIMTCSACGQSYKLVGNNKQNDKLVDSMIKYYTINKFVPNKGTMVSNESYDEFNPF